MKDGKRLQTTESVIRIDAVRREDKGMYQCFVRNDQDSAQSTSELKLGGRCKLHESSSSRFCAMFLVIDFNGNFIIIFSRPTTAYI